MQFFYYLRFCGLWFVVLLLLDHDASPQRPLVEVDIRRLEII